MTRTQRLAPVIQHTDNKQQKALQAVAFSQNRVEDEITRLEQLTSYKSEYLLKQQQGDAVYAAVDLLELNRFLAQLDDTIEKQKQVITLRKNELEHKREAWKSSLVDSKVIHKVVDNMERQRQFDENKAEQKTQDDLSQRRSLI